MRFGSLFAGIGGLDLGLERAGMECAWQVEIDDYCTRVLAKHWPDVPKYKDVCDVGKQNLEPVDLIAGGFPCQPHSVAGKRKGAEDDRNLWPEYLRIVREVKPRYVLGENVLGIVSTYIDTVLSDLESEATPARHLIFQLSPLMHHTDERESLLLPTPSATDHKGAGKTGKLRDRLDYAAERGATKSKEFFPTPRVFMAYGAKRTNPSTFKNLEDCVEDPGQLNPMWVEWLMGFPPGWTDLEDSETP